MLTHILSRNLSGRIVRQSIVHSSISRPVGEDHRTKATLICDDTFTSPLCIRNTSLFVGSLVAYIENVGTVYLYKAHVR